MQLRSERTPGYSSITDFVTNAGHEEIAVWLQELAAEYQQQLPQLLSQPLDENNRQLAHVLAEKRPLLLPLFLELGMTATECNQADETPLLLLMQHFFDSNDDFYFAMLKCKAEAESNDEEFVDGRFAGNHQKYIKMAPADLAMKLASLDGALRQEAHLEGEVNYHNKIKFSALPALIALCLIRNGADINTRQEKKGRLIHLFAAQFPQLLEYFFEFKPNNLLLDDKGHNVIRIMLDYDVFPSLPVISRLIEQGLDLNSPGSKGQTLLHDAALQGAEAIPLLMSGGAKASVSDSDGNDACEFFIARDVFTPEDMDLALPLIAQWTKPELIDEDDRNILTLLMMREDFLDEHIDVALSLMQIGLPYATKNIKQQTLLDIIFEKHPEMRQILLEKGIPEDKINDPVFVFATINIAEFRLALLQNNKRQSLVHQERNHYFNFLLYLAAARDSDASLLNSLPLEILYRIVAEAAPDSVEKKQAVALFYALLSQPETWRAMLKQQGGGVNVVQQKEQEKWRSTFFQSAEQCALTFTKLPETATAPYIATHQQCLDKQLALFKNKNKADDLARVIRGTTFFAKTEQVKRTSTHAGFAGICSVKRRCLT